MKPGSQRQELSGPAFVRLALPARYSAHRHDLEEAAALEGIEPKTLHAGIVDTIRRGQVERVGFNLYRRKAA